MGCHSVGFAVFCNKSFLGANVRTPSQAVPKEFRHRFVCALGGSSQAKFSRRECSLLLSLTASSYILPRRALSEDTRSAYDIVARKNGQPFSLAEYRNKLTLFVNVATYCALTPQYEGLVALHDEYQPRGFEIVASPCDQFGHQEPGSDDEICAFAKKQFGAKFLLLDKLNVNDAPGGVSPLYKFLKDRSPEGTGQRVSWNFEKFLVGADGKVLRRYKPGILPQDIESDIKWALDHPGEPLPPKKKPYLGVV